MNYSKVSDEELHEIVKMIEETLTMMRDSNSGASCNIITELSKVTDEIFKREIEKKAL